jgi:hypothetical protein
MPASTPPTALHAYLALIIASLGDLGSSFVFYRKDAFDQKTYDEPLLTGRILGAAMRYGPNFGRLIFHEKHELLFKYAGLEFIMKNDFLPFSLMSNIKETWREQLIRAEVRIRRTSGKIQSALLYPDQGLVLDPIQGRLLVKVQYFFDADEEGIRYKEHDYLMDVFNPKGFGLAYKHIDLVTLLKDNPHLRFDFTVPNPQDHPVYEKYIKGNDEEEVLYKSLNEMYNRKLQNFVDRIHSVVPAADTERITFSIYQCEDEIPKVEPMEQHLTYAQAVVGC